MCTDGGVFGEKMDLIVFSAAFRRQRARLQYFAEWKRRGLSSIDDVEPRDTLFDHGTPAEKKEKAFD